MEKVPPAYYLCSKPKKLSTMLTRCFSLFFLLVFFVACGPPPKFSEDEIAEQETAWKKMTDVHDEVMPLVMHEMQETVEEKSPDFLKQVQGIGPTYAKRLFEGGIRSMRSLADMDPAELAELAQMKNSDKAADWIQQAKGLASS